MGQWLSRALLGEGWSVTGAALSRPEPGSVLSAEEIAMAHWVTTDMRREDDVARLLDQSRPDAVFHLAGVTFVPDAQGSPTDTFDVNALGAVRLLTELGRRRRADQVDPVILIIGSGTQYGKHDPRELPLTESAEQRPRDVYGASKAAQEIIALQNFRAEGLRVICTRSFNHSGRGHAPHFLLPALVQRALAVRKEGGGVLRLGNQDSVRDYLHVTDVVRAYLLLAEHGSPGDVYNVCSGVGVSARELAADVLLHVGSTAEITTDPTLVRPVDIPALVGSPAKLQRATGWRAARTRAEIIDDLIDAATH